MADTSRNFRIGVMRMNISGADPEKFDALCEGAVEEFKGYLTQETNLEVEALAFDGPHVDAEGSTYSPLDFVQIGIAERAERGFSFLLIVTDVDLSSSRMTYTLALPSTVTNVGIMSTKRLDPTYWGLADDPTAATRRLSTLMLHTFGALLNLHNSDKSTNIMAPIGGIESLDGRSGFSDAQRAEMQRNLPIEALDMVTATNKAGFALKTIIARLPSILRATVQANPIRLVSKLPTMLATALSVIVVLIFAAETWDYAGEVSPLKISIFSLFSFCTAVFVLYRAFAFDSIVSRDGKLMESTVVTVAATALTLFLAMVFLFMFLGGLMWFVAEVAFPEVLKETWSSVDPVTTIGDHAKLSAFLASIGILAGSLGGAADSRNIVRNVLFANREV